MLGSYPEADEIRSRLGANDAIADAMRSAVGNPSSAHLMGAEARAMLEDAPDSVCKLIPALLPEGIIFTPGGTEANNAVILLRGACQA